MSESTSSPAESRALTDAERAYVDDATHVAFVLYEGVAVPHRSCGIALAETFGLPSRAYQSLRRGGITGMGSCGAIRAGEQVLGEVLGDPNPDGGVTTELRAAITWYQGRVATDVDRQGSPDLICNNLTRRHGEFTGAARKAFCTNLAAQVASLTAEAIVRFGSVRPAISHDAIDKRPADRA